MSINDPNGSLSHNKKWSFPTEVAKIPINSIQYSVVTFKWKGNVFFKKLRALREYFHFTAFEWPKFKWDN